MIGPEAGITVSAINTLILLAIFPGALPTGPIYNFAAVLVDVAWNLHTILVCKTQMQTENFGNYLRNTSLDYYISNGVRNRITCIVMTCY